MVWVQLTLLPQASVAVQVRAITSEAPQPLVTASAWVMVTWLQASCAEATPVALVLVSAGHSSTRAGGRGMGGRVIPVEGWAPFGGLPAPSVRGDVRGVHFGPPPPCLAIPRKVW